MPSQRERQNEAMTGKPTPEEIERVNAYNEARRKEQWAANMAEREAKIDAHVQRITRALIDERVTEVEIEEMDQAGEIGASDGYLKLTFASGRTLKVSVGGWSEQYLEVEVSDG